MIKVKFVMILIITVRVTGGKVNRRAGYGLEIPCVHQFYGPKPYIDKLREVIDSLKTSGLV